MEKEWIKGPALVEWLRQEKLVQEGVTEAAWPSFMRRVREWEKEPNKLAHYSTVDRWLTTLGSSLSFLPDELYSDGPPPRISRRLTEDEQRGLIAAIEAGERTQVIAERFRVSRRAVNYYKNGRRDDLRTAAA